MTPELIPPKIEIISKEDYILVKPPRGINYSEILMTLGKLIPMPDFQEKNDIWIFRLGKVCVRFSDLASLKDLSREYYPKISKGRKTALVVSSGFQRGLAETYISTGENHPREIKVFSDLRQAENWVKG